MASLSWTRALFVAASLRLGCGLTVFGKQNSTSSSNASSSSSDTPVTRVVNMLKDMKATLNSEMEEDKELYGKMACWCHDNEWNKSQEVSDLESTATDLTTSIDSLAATVSELDAFLEELEKQIAADKKSLAEATAVRKAQSEAFHGEDLNATQALEAVRAALEILSKHHEEALPQFSSSFLAVQGRSSGSSLAKDAPSLSDAFDEFLKSHGVHAEQAKAKQPVATPAVALASSATSVSQHGGAWTAEQTSVVKHALEAAASFVHAHGQRQDFHPAYAAQSAEIVGILKELKEQMEADLSDEQRAELDQAQGFEQLRADKTAGIQAAEAQAEAKEDEHAKARLDLAEAKEDLEQTEAALAEANKFMTDLKATCTESEANFEERKATRQQEIAAVSEAIQILMGDDARDAMSATLGSFLQLSSTSMSSGDARRQAAALLRKAGGNVSNPALSILATRTELDSFTRVKAAIDKMVAALKQEQQDEVKKVDYCKGEVHETEGSIARTESAQADLEARGEELNMTYQQQAEQLAAATAEIAALQVNLQRATETRHKESLEYQKTMADHRAVEAALKDALHRLAIFYDKKLLLVQAGRRQLQAPPVPQKTYKPHQGASGVMELIGTLIQDTKALQDESLKGEQQAQQQYEMLVADTSRSVAALQRTAATKKKEMGDTGAEYEENSDDIVEAVNKLEDLHRYKSGLHSECDWITTHFEARQTARSQEIEALQSAKQILSGADLS